VERRGNGGFPEPLPGGPVRLVRCPHRACGGETRVRLPEAVPAQAVRRVVCEACRRPFDCEAAVDEGVVEPPPAGTEAGSAPAGGRPGIAVPGWLADPESAAWRYLSIPIAAAAVIGALALIQGC
jgi:hypothetical protein